MKLSQKSIDFINKYVLGELGFDTINDDNLQAIVDFIVDNFEVPMAQAMEVGEQIDEDLLNLAAAVVTEITTNPQW